MTVKELKAGITSKRELNQVIADLNKARAKTLVKSKSGTGTVYQETLQKQAAKRKGRTIVLSPILSATKQPLPTSLPKPIYDAYEETPVTKDDLRRELLNEWEPLGTGGKFPTEEQAMAERMGLKEKDARNYTKFMRWVTENFTSNYRWKENYLKGIDGQIEMAAMQGFQDAVDALLELRRLVENMDMQDFIIGQLTRPQRLAIRVYYLGRDGEAEYVDRINTIIYDWQSLYV